ncbi:MAG: apolipoprotein N-acyltransferase [Candidatus Cloacimonadota bacterium]|nr:apolipoprotein N-acyltransferase [Candidatus Cloacimonadota bacterium]
MHFKINKWQLAIISGILFALSFIGIGLGFLSFLAFIPYLMLLKRSNPKQSFFYGLLFGAVLIIISAYAILFVRIYAFLGLLIGMALYLGLLSYFIKKVELKFPKIFYFVFPMIWIGFDHFMTLGQLNFPWFNIGYSLADYYYLIQFADVLGIYGLSFVVILINILIYRLLSSRFKTFKWIILIFILWFGYGIYKHKTIQIKPQNLKIGLIQLNVNQEDKWKKELFKPITDDYIEQIQNLSTKQNVNLVILPESAIAKNLLHNHVYQHKFSEIAIKNHVNIVVGFPDYDVQLKGQTRQVKYYNSATLIDSLGKYHEKYSKIKLVPFGERIPLLNTLPILKKLQFGQANFEYGVNHNLYELNGFDFPILICFEGVFPELTRDYAARGADFLVVITNDAWFQKTVFPIEHANNTKLRAIETRLPLFRVANTGISYIIDPKGREIRKSKLFTKENLVSYLPSTLEDIGKTFFVKIGYIFPIICFWSSIFLILYSLITSWILFRNYGK